MSKNVKFLDNNFVVPNETKIMVLNPDGSVLATNGEEVNLEYSEDFNEGFSWVSFSDKLDISEVFIKTVGEVNLKGYPANFWKTYTHTI